MKVLAKKDQARRLAEWPELLTAELDERRDLAFEWGRQDCAMLMVALVQAMTGKEIWTRQYKTAREAMEILQDFSDDLGGAVREVSWRHGWKPISAPRARAQRGDVVMLLDGGCRRCLGVCLGAECVTAGKDGVVTLPMEHVTDAWRIPLKGGRE